MEIEIEKFICECLKEFNNYKSFLRHRCRCKLYKEKNDLSKIITKEILEDLYLNQQLSLPDLKEKFNLNSWTPIVKLLKLYGMKTRTISESAKSNNRKDKYKKYCLNTYGTEHIWSKNSSVRIKIEQKLLDEGYSNWFQKPEIKEKSKQTILKKYGKELYKINQRTRGKNSYSKIHKEVVEELSKLKIDFYIELKLPKENGFYYSYDILIDPNLIVEVNGDYWHGNPEIYKANDIILKGSSREILVQEKWDYDLEKLNIAKDLGYDILVIWEKDWKLNKELCLERINNARDKN